MCGLRSSLNRYIKMVFSFEALCLHLVLLGSISHLISQTYHDHEIISSNTVWSAADSPHRILGYVLLTGNATLTIEPGCIVEFEQGAYIGLQSNVHDSLVSIIAIGTETDSIIFRGWNNATWNGISLTIMAPNRSQKYQSSFRYCVFENSDNWLAFDNASIENNVFREGTWGIFLEDMDSSVIAYNEFRGSKGIKLSNMGNVHIASNLFNGLTDVGVNAENCDSVFIAGNIFQNIQSNHGAIRLYFNDYARITNSNTFSNCSYPLSIHPVSQLDPTNTSLPTLGNDQNIIKVIGPLSTLQSDHFYNFGLPYVMDGLEGSIYKVYQYNTLHVDEGVSVKVASGYKIKASTMYAYGTSTDTILFTCLDTMNKWLGLELTHGVLNYTTVENADSNGAAGILLDGTIYNPDVVIGNCILKGNFYGIHMKSVENYDMLTWNVFDANESAGLFIEDSRQIHIENQTFRNHLSQYGAILLRNADTILIKKGLVGTSTNNTWTLTQDIFSQLHQNCEFNTTGNINNGIQFSGIDNNGDFHYLHKFNIPYVMTRIFGGVRVNGRMEIAPGATVLFAPNTALEVYQPDSGEGIFAEGTPTDSIHFAALKPDSGWDGININFADTLVAGVFKYCAFSGASSTIGGALTLNQSPEVIVEHSNFHDNYMGLEIEESPGFTLNVENTFQHNQRAGLVLNQSPNSLLSNQYFKNHTDAELAGLYLYESPEVKLSNCHFESNRYPIAMSFNSYLDSLSTFSLLNNQYDAILVSGQNQDSVYFYNLGLEYHLSNVLSPPRIYGYLRIDPGVTVRTYPEIVYLNVSGRIEANGTPTDSISFLPISDDTVWYGLKIYSQGSGVFSYCKFEGAVSVGFGGALYLYRTNQVSIGHSLFKDNSVGIYLYQVNNFSSVTWTTFDNNKYAGIWAKNSDTIDIQFNTFKNHINDSTYGALYFERSHHILLEDNNTSTNNLWYLTITPDCGIEPTSFINSSIRDRIQVVNGSTDRTVHWPKLNKDYEITGFSVNFQHPVTFARGVRVYIDSLSNIVFGDTFNIIGTQVDSIFFIAADTSKGYGTIRADAPGEFRYCKFAYNKSSYNPALLIANTDAKIDSCYIYGNTYGVKIFDISTYNLVNYNLFEHNACALYIDNVPHPEIKNQVFRYNGTLEGAVSLHRSPEAWISQCTFENNEWPIAMDMKSYAYRYSNVDLTNNTNPVIRILSSSTNTSVTWWPIGADYLVSGPISVLSGGSLTIRSGIGTGTSPTVRMLENTTITVRGTLQVWGSLSDSVRFIGNTDTTVWSQISLFTYEHAEFQYAVFENASNYGAISANSSSNPLRIKNCSFRNNETAINLMNVYAKIDSCSFHWNNTAISVSGFYTNVDTPEVRKCDIYGNDVGIANTSTYMSVKAAYNFWGDSTGPHDPSTGPPDYNPDGLGDSVTDYVIYRPWLTEPEFGWVLLYGDVDGDGDIDADDVDALAQYLYYSGSPPNPLERADANHDGVVDDRDVVYLSNLVFQNTKLIVKNGKGLQRF